ncbi:hypothetical protein B816_888 [Weissella confusa]|uniref:restriction endonuclease n=1 Tax=Weissella confusa TaxID=1583 RepID=UPI0022FEB5CB|nr:restriction endonuclease [Weissella confusa]MDA5459397.1 hypothetical protein [Weissella confusa]
MVEFFWVLLFGGALLLGYSSQKQNQQANEEVVADEIVDLPHDDLVTTNDVPARRQRKTEEEHIRDYVNELIQYENLKDTDKVRYKRKFLNSDVYKLGDELPSDIEKIETPVGVTLVKPVLNSTKMFRGLLEPVELNVSGGFEDICHSPQFAQWLTLLFELFDGDVVGRIDYLTKTLSIIVGLNKESQTEYIFYVEERLNEPLGIDKKYFGTDSVFFMSDVHRYSADTRVDFEDAGISPVSLEYFRILMSAKSEVDEVFDAKFANSLAEGFVIPSNSIPNYPYSEPYVGRLKMSTVHPPMLIMYEEMIPFVNFEKISAGDPDAFEGDNIEKKTYPAFRVENEGRGVHSAETVTEWFKGYSDWLSEDEYAELKEKNRIVTEAYFDELEKQLTDLSDKLLGDVDDSWSRQLVDSADSEESFLDLLQRTNPYVVEYLVGIVLSEKTGFNYEVTQKSGDQGVDVILRDGEDSIGVQVKRYSSNVGNSAVQEIVAGEKLNGYSQSIVVATAGFTKSAEELAVANGVELIDGHGLYEIILPFLHSKRFLNDIDAVAGVSTTNYSVTAG